MAKLQVGLRLNEPARNKMNVIAKRENRSFNNAVEHAIELYIINYEQEHGPIQEPSQEP